MIVLIKKSVLLLNAEPRMCVLCSDHYLLARVPEIRLCNTHKRPHPSALAVLFPQLSHAVYHDIPDSIKCVH